ncbi:hypothetical protein [Amycolatopsis magusensis]|uniref:Flap endonuclease-1-like 5' DNA nuclease n=1 Tax=Amycolatopsis magusensis TaxID=882444 RepID=A0ABS4Q6J6_9PSEU|nr:hypothetical protein [Amycolatopsis magusensis]MBP2186698.1 putative flap endonuclease-1-like 5' DNA nuclease [Amycolatopsis magusensis]
MTTRAQLRKTALTFREVEEDTTAGVLRYSVRGKEFASLTPDGVVRLRLPGAVAAEAVAAYPNASRLSHAGRSIGFQAPLAEVGGQHLWALVMAAWKHRAPAKLAADLTAIVDAPAQPVGDLPRSIGKPATRALALAGVTTLDQAATWTEADLLALHGVGPKVVRILNEILAEKGRSLG